MSADLDRALTLAFRHLNRRERTLAEMRSHLRARDLDPEDIDAALARLLDDGYLDDARYARVFAEDKRSLERWGSERIRRELIKRGVDRKLIEAAVAGVPGNAVGADATEGELERACAVLRKRFPAGTRDRRERERALGVLLRKGYAYEVARDALVACGHE